MLTALRGCAHTAALATPPRRAAPLQRTRVLQQPLQHRRLAAGRQRQRALEVRQVLGQRCPEGGGVGRLQRAAAINGISPHLRSVGGRGRGRGVDGMAPARSMHGSSRRAPHRWPAAVGRARTRRPAPAGSRRRAPACLSTRQAPSAARRSARTFVFSSHTTAACSWAGSAGEKPSARGYLSALSRKPTSAMLLR